MECWDTILFLLQAWQVAIYGRRATNMHLCALLSSWSLVHEHTPYSLSMQTFCHMFFNLQSFKFVHIPPTRTLTCAKLHPKTPLAKELYSNNSLRSQGFGLSTLRSQKLTVRTCQEAGPQKETHLPTVFQVRTVSFREGNWGQYIWLRELDLLIAPNHQLLPRHWVSSCASAPGNLFIVFMRKNPPVFRKKTGGTHWHISVGWDGSCVAQNQNLQSLQLTNQSQQISDKAHDFYGPGHGNGPCKKSETRKICYLKISQLNFSYSIVYHVGNRLTFTCTATKMRLSVQPFSTKLL